MKAKRTMLSVFLTLAMVASLCAITAAPAGAQALSLSPSSGATGASVTVTGAGFTTDTYDYAIDFTDSLGSTTQDLATGTTTSGSQPSDTVTIPDGAATGDGTVTVYLDTGNDGLRTGTEESATATFTVTEADSNADGVAITPNHGPVDEMVTVRVYDTGDFAHVAEEEPLIVKYAGSEVDTTPAEPEMGADSGEPDDDPTEVRATIYFDVPDSEIGDHTVKVVAGVVSGEEDYTVEPKVTISDETAKKGSTQTATCTGFDGGYSIDVFVDGNKVGSGTTNSDGTAEVSCTMDYEGPTIDATDGAGNDAVHTPDSFSFIPGISLDPTSGAVCTTVTLSATDFHEAQIKADAGTTVNVDELKIGGEAITSLETGDSEITEAVDQEEEDLEPGKWILTSTLSEEDFEIKFQVPSDLSSGSKEVYLKTDTTPSEDASATFTVGAASLEISPSEGPFGETISVSASGLVTDAEDYYDLDFENDPGGPATEEVKSELDTNSEGELSTTFEVSADDRSNDEDYDVKLMKNGDKVVSATYHVIPVSLTVTPEEGPVGTEVTITGEGYAASTGYDILFYNSETDTTTPIAYVTTTDVGGFSTGATIPSSTKGEMTIKDDQSPPLDTVTFEVTKAEAAVEVEEGLTSVWGNLDESVWYFDNATKTWSQYYKADPTAVPQESRLATLESDTAYWVHVTADTTFSYGGKVKSLTEGWNVLVMP